MGGILSLSKNKDYLMICGSIHQWLPTLIVCRRQLHLGAQPTLNGSRAKFSESHQKYRFCALVIVWHC